MITNNGKALMYVSDWHEDNSNDPTYTLQRTNGTEAQIKRNTTAYDKKLGYSSLANNLKIVVGSGNTPVTPNDFCLANEITSSNLVVIAADSRNKNNCNTDYNVRIIMEASATLKNISSNDTITIKEVGLVTQDDTGASYLLMREVLGSEQYPIITLMPNETFALTLGVNKSGPNNWSSITNNASALFYINNFGNGKNNNGGSEYPGIIMWATDNNFASNKRNITVRRSYLTPQFENGNNQFNNTNYQSIIDSLRIYISSSNSSSAYPSNLEDTGQVITSSISCRNKQNCNISYNESSIIQITQTFVNIDSYPKSVQTIGLIAKNYKAENLYDRNRWWETATNRQVELARLQLPQAINFPAGSSITFTIVIG